MKKLDIYIIRKYLGTFFFSLLLFMSIAVVIDISEKIDSFIGEKIPLKEILFDYYLYFFPWIGLMLSPIFVFLSVIIFTSRLTNNSEIVAMTAGRVSFYRLLLPYLIAASFLTCIFLAFNHRWLPYSVGKKMQFEEKYKINTLSRTFNNIHFRPAKDTFVYFQNFNEIDTVAYKFALEVIKEKKLLYKIKAERLVWNGKAKAWNLEEYEIRKNIYPFHDSIETGYKKTMKMPFGAKEFYEAPTYKETMNTNELEKYIKKEKMKGSENLKYYYAEKYKRTANPIGTIILTIIAVAMTTKKSRGGMGLSIVIGLALAGIYFLFLQFSTVFATKGTLDPFIGTWLPNIVFGTIALLLMLMAKK